MEPADWQDSGLDLLCVEMRTASGTPLYDALKTAIVIIINTGEKRAVTLPKLSDGKVWVNRIDTTVKHGAVFRTANGNIECPANSLMVMTLEDAA